jgi:hypothetical protein
MANKRLSDLTPILTSELASDDLLLVADISTKQSKKITTANLANYILSTGSYTSSVFNSINSETASYYSGTSLTTTNIFATSTTSSAGTFQNIYVTNTIVGDLTGNADTATNADTASYVDASNINGTVVSTTSISSSFASSSISSSISLTSNTSISSSHLIYINGVNNGRVTNADTASIATTALSSLTATLATTSTSSISSSYAVSSSYSTISNKVIGYYNSYGPYNQLGSFITQTSTLAMSTDTGGGIYNVVKINPMPGESGVLTNISVCGDITLPISNSVYRATASLFIYNTDTDTTTSIDTSYPTSYMTSLAANGGQITIPIYLKGAASLSGSYVLSFNIISGSIDSNRYVSFYVDAKTDDVTTGLAYL